MPVNRNENLETLIMDAFGKLFTQDGEILAEGSCQVDEERGSVTLRPVVDTPLLVREQGNLRLELENGAWYELTDRIIRFRLNAPGVPSGNSYRLFLTTQQRLRSGSIGGEE